MSRRVLVIALVLGLAAGTAAAATRARTTVKVGKTSLGRVLIDARGRTLYLFDADKNGKSACYGQCAAAWPPLLSAGAPAAGAGVKASLLGVVKRRDGKLQVTYGGHPLYLFAHDAKAGETSGDAVRSFGGSWHAVAPTGKPVEPAAKSSPGTTTGASDTPPTGYPPDPYSP